MQITSKRTGQALRICLSGELDHHTAEKIRRSMDSEILASKCNELIIDMRGVTFMDSSGLGVVLGRYKLMTARGGTVSIVGTSKPIERIFRMSGLFSLIKKIERA